MFPLLHALVYAHTVFSTELWFYQRHPRRTWATLGAIGGIVLAPAVLARADITSVDVPTGNSTFASNNGAQH